MLEDIFAFDKLEDGDILFEQSLVSQCYMPDPSTLTTYMSNSQTSTT